MQMVVHGPSLMISNSEKSDIKIGINNMRLHFLFIFYLLVMQILITGCSSTETGSENAIMTTNRAADKEKELDIWVPRNHNPEFVEPGNIFMVEAKGSPDLLAE